MDSVSSSLNPYKHLKEQFVSNLSGSSMLEVAALSTIVPLLFLLRHVVHSRTDRKKNDDATVVPKKWKDYLSVITVDFLFIVLPMLLVFTVLADWTYTVAILLTLVISIIAAAKRFVSSGPSTEGSVSLQENISSYRITVMISTCLCILAVDFTIFPRKYAKTETYGTSMMDLGVGSFILANSLVSRQARSNQMVNWKNSIKSTSPLLVLGFIRLLSTRSVDYQVHTGEYGVHWNFFFTLAVVAILTSVINIPRQYSGILGVIILIGYQGWLILGLNTYLLSDNRAADIISQNKEGIFSILGYWGMYLVGVQLGYYLLFQNDSSSTLRSNKWRRIRIALFSLSFWLVTILLDRHVERVSRRTCNLAYVTLVLAQNLQVLAILLLSDLFAESKISALEEAFNHNLLGSFLLANLLTGLVNLFVDTLFSSLLSSLLILIVYAYALSVITAIADFFNVRLKFW